MGDALHLRWLRDQLGDRFVGGVIFHTGPHATRTIEHAIAKATHQRSKRMWKLYWQRADLKWHGYQPVREVQPLEQFVAVVDEDAYGCFFG